MARNSQKRKKIFKQLLWAFATIFILMNIVAIFHAYKFTNFTENQTKKTKHAQALTLGQRISTLIFGVDNPRPINEKIPLCDFETVILNSNKKIECWHIKNKEAKGTVILFHGFGG